MKEEFIGEAIKPVRGTADSDGMSRGEAGFPKRFTWRGEEYELEEIQEKWKETSPCRHGGGEKYVRKHWFKVRTTDGTIMKIYFERQTRSSRTPKQRWWLYTIEAT